MEINGTINGDLNLFKLNHNRDNGNLFAILRIDTKVKSDKAAKIFGESFTAVAFGAMAEKTNGQAGTYEFPYESLKPRLVGERHNLTIGEVEAVIEPKIVKVAPYKSEAEVIATIELPIFVPRAKDTGDVTVAGKKMLGELAALFGRVVSAKLNSKQLPLELPEGGLATKAGNNWGSVSSVAFQSS